MIDIMFTASTGFAVILCIIPGIIHVQTRNYGAIFMTMWVIAANFITFVNSLIWTDYFNLDDNAEAWCLTTTPIYNAANYGLLGAATCTIYTMYTYVASPIILTERVKKRRALITFLFTVILPLILMSLNYTIRLAKYGLRPILGCFNVLQQNWVFFILNNMWPPIIALIGCYYAGRTSFAIIKKRLEIQSLLAYNESGMNSSYYYRLVLFCITFLISALPAALLNTFSNLLEGITPFDMSSRNLSAVIRFPGEARGASFIDYAKPLSGFVLFIFFGTGQEAIATYKRWAIAIKLDLIFSGLRDRDDVSRSSPAGTTVGTLKSFQGRSNLYSNNGDTRQTRPRSRSFLNASKVRPPPPVVTRGKEKPSAFKNLLFLNGHRTPSEQAKFDLTSGLRIRIDGVDVETTIPEVDEDLHDLHERPAPAYNHPQGIQQVLEGDDDDDDFGTNRYDGDIEEIGDMDEEIHVEYEEDIKLEALSVNPMSQIGSSVSHIDHLLGVYEVPSINVVPSSPGYQTYAMVRVHDTDTFVANGIDDVIDEYSQTNRNIESQRSSSYSETGIAL